MAFSSLWQQGPKIHRACARFAASTHRSRSAGPAEMQRPSGAAAVCAVEHAAAGSGVPSPRDDVATPGETKPAARRPRATLVLCGEQDAHRYQALMLPDNHVLPNVGKPKQKRHSGSPGPPNSRFRPCFTLNNKTVLLFYVLGHTCTETAGEPILAKRRRLINNLQNRHPRHLPDFSASS